MFRVGLKHSTPSGEVKQTPAPQAQSTGDKVPFKCTGFDMKGACEGPACLEIRSIHKMLKVPTATFCHAHSSVLANAIVIGSALMR